MQPEEPPEDWQKEVDCGDLGEILNCAKADFRQESHWPYGRPRQDLPMGGGAFVPSSVEAATPTRYSPLLRVAKSRGFSLNGWGLVSTGIIPKSRKKGGETCIAALKGTIFRPSVFPLVDRADSYELPGHLSVDGSMLDSWPPFVAHTFDPREVNCSIRYDYSSNEMALFSWTQMTPGDEFLTDFQSGFFVDKLVS